MAGPPEAAAAAGAEVSKWRIRSSFSGQVGERRAEGPGGYGSPVFGSLWPVFADQADMSMNIMVLRFQRL